MAGATETIYNPLIKKGFQEIADIGSIQAALDALQNAVNELQGNKITKITDSAQLSTIEENEIFQWQTDNATIDGTNFKNSYFYKCSTNSITLPTGTQFFENGSDVVNLYGYDVRIGSFYIIEDNTPPASNDFYNFRVMEYTDSRDYLFFNLTFPSVGEAVWNRANNEVVTVVSVDENLTLTLSDGQTVTTANSSWSHPYKIYKVLSDYGEYFNVCSCPQMNVYIFLPDYVVNGNNFTPNDWFTIEHSPILTTVEPTEIGQYTYAQTNTQQQQLTLVNNVPVYTLSDETTEINLVSENTLPNIPIDFTDAAASGNILTGDTLGIITKKISQNYIFTFNEALNDYDILLVADVTDWYAGQQVNVIGFAGTCFGMRPVGNQNSVIANVINTVQYSSTQYNLYSSNTSIVCSIITYNGKQYLAIQSAQVYAVSYFQFVGIAKKLLSTFIHINRNTATYTVIHTT